LKIVFMGTPEFAATALEALAQSEHEVGYVVSQPDKAKNRGKKLLPTPVKEMAEKYGIEVLQPEKIKTSEETINILKEYKPDIAVVAAYGQILSKEILDIPKLGCVNIHGSLLPKFRGAAPIQRSIIEGEEVTGITLMHMSEGLDCGDMIAKVETAIDKKTVDELYEELAKLGADLLLETLPKIEDGTADRIPQDDSLATYAPMLFKADGLIDFSKGAVEIERLIRGYAGAYTMLDGEVFKIWVAQTEDGNCSQEPGIITEVLKNGIKVATGNGYLILTEVQAAGKKRMDAGSFVRGSHLEVGTKLG